MIGQKCRIELVEFFYVILYNVTINYQEESS